jgi:hypothetical protein
LHLSLRLLLRLHLPLHVLLFVIPQGSAVAFALAVLPPPIPHRGAHAAHAFIFRAFPQQNPMSTPQTTQPTQNKQFIHGIVVIPNPVK